jgi:hypothetical protein
MKKFFADSSQAGPPRIRFYSWHKRLCVEPRQADHLTQWGNANARGFDGAIQGPLIQSAHRIEGTHTMTSIDDRGDVEFTFYRKDAASVTIVGNFGAWESGRREMTPRGDGWWTLRAALPEGEYRFHYQADGERFTDYASHGVEFYKKQWHGVLYVRGPASSEKLRMAA